jgi:hypothetical protein
MDDSEFQAAFESCSLQRSDWDHRAHVRMAWLYLREHGLEAAVTRMREGIFRYDEGTDQLCNYHETLTRFWMHFIARGLEGAPRDEDFESFLARNPVLADKRLVLQYYSQPRIVSDEARANYLEPDLRPLDTAPEASQARALDLT